MSEGAKGGHFKLVLALVLLIGIIGLVVYANAGHGFLNAFKTGKIANVQQKEPFGIALSTVATALYGKSFTISGSPFSFDGVCSSVKVGGLKIEGDQTRCSASADSFTGTFQYTQFGSILLTGSAGSVKVNSNKYSSATPISFEFEVIPTGFLVTGISEIKISLVAPSGKIERYGKDGSLKSIAYLSQSTLDLNNLVANAMLERGELKLTGTATSVKSEEFSW